MYILFQRYLTKEINTEKTRSHVLENKGLLKRHLGPVVAFNLSDLTRSQAPLKSHPEPNYLICLGLQGLCEKLKAITAESENK